MSKHQFFIYRLFAMLFFTCFAWVFYLFFARGSVHRNFNGIIVLLGTVVFLFLMFLFLYLTSKIHPSNVRVTETLLLVFLFAAYISLQIFFASELYTRESQQWDFPIVSEAAKQYVSFGTVHDTLYFARFKNNIPLFLLLTGVFKLSSLIGYNNFSVVGITINIVSIDVSVFFLYLTAKKIKGRALALLSTIIMMITVPLLCYSPIYYTDTLTLIYPILALYLWICAKQNIKNNSRRKALFQVIAAALALVAGGLLKISVLIVLVAIITDALISLSFKRAVVVVSVVTLIFSFFFFPLYSAATNKKIMLKDNELDHIPFTHWIMMGLKGNGTFDNSDYEMTLSIPSNDRDGFIKDEILRRVKEYGFIGMIDHLSEKNAFVWADGTYYAPVKNDRDRMHSSVLDRYILLEGKYFYLYGYYCQFLLLALVVCFMLASWYLFKDKDFNFHLFPFALSVFGIFLFQMVWEARSRYLLNFVPIFILIATCCYAKLYERVIENANKRLNLNIPPS